jgi:putative addiction module component (TIGR02574 family)
MTDTAEKLKTEVLQLAENERAELAYCLIRSLDDDTDESSEAWETELERRWQEMENGSVRGIPAEVAFAEMRKKYP